MPLVSQIAMGHLIPYRTGYSDVLYSDVLLISSRALFNAMMRFSGFPEPFIPQNSRGAIAVSQCFMNAYNNVVVP